MSEQQQNHEFTEPLTSEAPAGLAPTGKTTTPRARSRTSSPACAASRRTVSFVLQGKGGCGKTLVASLIAQSLKERGEPVVCIDTDPVNKSFTAIAALGAQPVRLVNGNKVDVGEMNAWSERAVAEDASFVVDNGASSYLPMLEYLLEAEIFEVPRRKRQARGRPHAGDRRSQPGAHRRRAGTRLEIVAAVCRHRPLVQSVLRAAGGGRRRRAGRDGTLRRHGRSSLRAGEAADAASRLRRGVLRQDARRQPDLRRRARRHRRRDDLADVAGADLEADRRADRPGAVAMDRQTVRAALGARPEEDAVFAVCAVLETIVKAEFAKLEAARARDAATMHEVRKILARLRPVGSTTPSWIEPAFWVVSTALVIALAALAFLLKLV
ncbi:MAG: hypothetical protein IPK66_17570 [Rhodospirillales bacterium]|nr:hypothetical protein [Rhodospirillales bacterium]